jgi:hypothetical protein
MWLDAIAPGAHALEPVMALGQDSRFTVAKEPTVLPES